MDTDRADHEPYPCNRCPLTSYRPAHWLGPCTFRQAGRFRPYPDAKDKPFRLKVEKEEALKPPSAAPRASPRRSDSVTF